MLGVALNTEVGGFQAGVPSEYLLVIRNALPVAALCPIDPYAGDPEKAEVSCEVPVFEIASSTTCTYTFKDNKYCHVVSV